MRIKEVNMYRVDLPMSCDFTFGGAQVVRARDSTIVEVITNTGLKGYGEVCPFGPTYLPGFAAGVRAGLQELTQDVLGANPLEVGKLNVLMDHHLKGHNYVKAGLDIACWDILGKHCKLPLYTLLGGHYNQAAPIYKTITQCSDEQTQADIATFTENGISIIQLKVSSGNVDEDIRRIKMVRHALPSATKLFVDPNGGWLMHEALRVVEAVRHLNVYIEQPCRTYQECFTLRAHTNLPIMLDESVDDIHNILQVIKDRSVDVVKIKPSTYGGLTKMKQARDLFVEHGIAVSIEETWGSGITDATIAHLAQSTPQ